jgi:hypothetical protein
MTVGDSASGWGSNIGRILGARHPAKNGDAVMNGTCPFAETIQPRSEANPCWLRAEFPAELFCFGERRFSTRSSATAPPSGKRFARRAAAKRLLSSVVIGLALTGCSSAKLLSVQDVSKGPASRPAVVYVADFELAPDSIQSETLFAWLPLHAYLEQSKARSLVATMSTSIVEDLAKKGIAADRLPANSSFPKQGWLVRGVFMKIDEGNRVKRAIIGFGSGQTDLEVATSTDELSAETAPAPLYRAQTGAKSNKLPGAAITLNPYVAAAKFVLDGHDLDRSTRATAEKIADEIAARVTGMPEPARSGVSSSKMAAANEQRTIPSGMIERILAPTTVTGT